MADRDKHDVGAAAQAADDLALVTRCRSGERAAARELFRREYPRVNATLYRVLGQTRDSEDLVQEAFLEVFRCLGSFRGEARLSTWIDKIAVRVAIHWLRTKKPAAVQLELVVELENDEEPPDRRAQAREGLRRLYHVMAGFTPETRTALALHLIDGRSPAEVAKLLGATEVATRVRLWRARRELERRAAEDPILGAYVSGGAR